MQFLFYYTRVLYGSTPGDLLSYPRRVDFSSLPPFYQAVLSAWVAVDGGFSSPAHTLVVASSSVRTPVSAVSTKSTYSLLSASQLVLLVLVVCLALSIGPPPGLSCFGLVLIAQ